jgi:hypothetical protein
LKWGLTNFFCLVWPETSIFWISAFLAAKIVGISYWHPAEMDFLKFENYILGIERKVNHPPKSNLGLIFEL